MDATLTTGNIIAIIGLVGGWITVYISLDRRVTRQEVRLEMFESEIKSRLTEMQKTIDRISEHLIKT
jgi:hypothetical protein